MKKLFDTHCDTAYVLERKGKTLDDNDSQITFEQTKVYDRYEQMFAIWSSHKRTDDENWEHFHKVYEFYKKEILSRKSERFVPHLAVEGASLVGHDLDRVNILKECGVRMMTLVWKDDSVIGGAHNTIHGFTETGKKVLDRMFDCGIVPDVSHASDNMTYQTIERALERGKPVAASHSNSRHVHPHSRNLTDEEFLLIKKTGGIVGINICREFLGDRINDVIDISTILTHIEHFMSLGGGDTLCIGCDFDGIHSFPVGITGLRDIWKIGEELSKLGYPGRTVEKIMFENASEFFKNAT